MPDTVKTSQVGPATKPQLGGQLSEHSLAAVPSSASNFVAKSILQGVGKQNSSLGFAVCGQGLIPAFRYLVATWHSTALVP